jgi:galectin-9
LAANRFEFNLMVGSVISEQLKQSGDIALHFNPRFDTNLVVRNSRQNGRWGPEEREPQVMPYAAGRDFETMLLIEADGFKVAVNGRHFCQFPHRIPLSCVGVLSIEGSVEVERIEYRREMKYTAPIVVASPAAPMPVLVSRVLGPIHNPPLPFRHAFGESLRPSQMIYISGRLTNSADRFSIDFTCAQHPHQNDIAFHFNPRIREAVVVRNHLQSGRWGAEERHANVFPFYTGANFDLMVQVEAHRFMVAINGQHFAEFRHRIPLQFVNGMNISGDVFITSIRFAQP